MIIVPLNYWRPADDPHATLSNTVEQAYGRERNVPNIRAEHAGRALLQPDSLSRNIGKRLLGAWGGFGSSASRASMEYQFIGKISQGYTFCLSKDLKSKDHVLAG